MNKILNYRQILNRKHPLNRGLISEWVVLPGLAGGNRLFDIASQNHGSLVNGVSWQNSSRPGGFGSLGFVGASSQSVNVGTSPLLQPSSLTIAFWTRRTATWNSGSGSFIWAKPNATFTGNGWYFEPYSSGPKSCSFVAAGFTGSDCRIAIAPDTLFPLATWVHVLLTFNGGSVRIWIDGREQTVEGSVASTITSTGDNKYIASNSPGYGNYLTGDMDDICIWNRDLSASEAVIVFLESRLGNPNRYNWIDISKLTQVQIRELYYRYNMFKSPVLTGIRSRDDEENN